MSSNAESYRRKRKWQETRPDLDVNCYMMDITLKSSFKGINQNIPQRPIFSIHSLNPAHFEKRGETVVQICNETEAQYPKRFSVSYTT